MRNQLRVRLLFVAEIVCYVLAVPPFVGAVNWISARPRAEVVAQYPELRVPRNWNYVLVNQGKAYEWKCGPANKHPVAVGLLAVSVASLGFLAFAIHAKRVKLLENEQGNRCKREQH